LLPAIRSVLPTPPGTSPSDSVPASAYSLPTYSYHSSSHLYSSIIIVAMQFNAQPPVQDPRFTPNTNHTPTKTTDNNPSAMSATRDHVDLDKQCGVPLFNGVPCPASLFCPSHTLPDKCSIPGRTAPLEQLMARQQQDVARQQQHMAQSLQQ
jgi:hypothetical protein